VEYRLDARLSSSPPRCSAARAFCCFGGAGGGGKESTVSSPETGRGALGASSPAYGGRTGKFCIVELDNVDWPEAEDSRECSFGGNASVCRPAVIEDIRGGGAFAADVVLSRVSGTLLSGRPLFGSPWSKSVVSPVLLVPALLTLVVLGKDGSPFGSFLDCDCFCRSFCCFFFKPCSKLMIISLIRGRYFSKLSTLAS
jgi:hypothetical protein